MSSAPRRIGGRYVNPANAITMARFAALPVFAWAILKGGSHDQIAMVALIYCGVLDLFDGAVARACGCASGFGELLDAIVDAICNAFFIGFLLYLGRLPLVPVVGFLALGAANVVMRGIYARRAGRSTNYRSFAMERVVAFAVYLGAFGVANFEPDYFGWTIFAVMFVTLAHDTKRMLIDPVPPADAAAGAAA